MLLCAPLRPNMVTGRIKVRRSGSRIFCLRQADLFVQVYPTLLSTSAAADIGHMELLELLPKCAELASMLSLAAVANSRNAMHKQEDRSFVCLTIGRQPAKYARAFTGGFARPARLALHLRQQLNPFTVSRGSIPQVVGLWKFSMLVTINCRRY